MSLCRHTRIITWRDPSGHATREWSCSDCGRRFAPLSDEQIEDLAARAKELGRLREIAIAAKREVD